MSWEQSLFIVPLDAKQDRAAVRVGERAHGRQFASICTSHVERCNLTIRTFVRRFTRLALGFSKKFDNLCAATALHVGVYNFVRVHRSLNMTPAMAAGVCPTLLNLPAFYDAVTAYEKDAKRVARTRRLIDRLRRPE